MDDGEKSNQVSRKKPPSMDAVVEVLVEILFGGNSKSSAGRTSQTDDAVAILYYLYDFFLGYAQHGLMIHRHSNCAFRWLAAFFLAPKYMKLLSCYYLDARECDSRIPYFGDADNIKRVSCLAKGVRAVFALGIAEHRFGEWQYWNRLEQNQGVLAMISLFNVSPQEIELLGIDKEEQNRLCICASLCDILLGKAGVIIPAVIPEVQIPQYIPDDLNVKVDDGTSAATNSKPETAKSATSFPVPEMPITSDGSASKANTVTREAPRQENTDSMLAVASDDNQARPPLESSHDESAPLADLTKTAKASRQDKYATSKGFQRMILVVLCELYDEDKNATLTPDAMAKRITAKGWIFNGEATPANICSKGINDIKLLLDKEGKSWSVSISMGSYRLIPPYYGRINTIKSIAEKLC